MRRAGRRRHLQILRGHRGKAEVMTKRKRPGRESVKAFWRVVVGDPPGDSDLWLRVTYWRERLRDCENYPILHGLETSWNVLERSGDAIDRDEPRAADTPLDALHYHIDTGFYPPPELLLALMDAYDVYCAAQGDLSLEEVFFGPPRRKAGGHAKRKGEKMRRIFWGFDLHTLMKKGHSKAKAAELVAEKYRGMYEPETIARRARMPRFKVRKQTV